MCARKVPHRRCRVSPRQTGSARRARSTPPIGRRRRRRLAYSPALSARSRRGSSPRAGLSHPRPGVGSRQTAPASIPPPSSQRRRTGKAGFAASQVARADRRRGLRGLNLRFLPGRNSVRSRARPLPGCRSRESSSRPSRARTACGQCLPWPRPDQWRP